MIDLAQANEDAATQGDTIEQALLSITSNDPVLFAALNYARRGWKVFPVGIDKQPLTPHGLLDASTDEAQIKEWFGVPSQRGVAIVCGNGLVVLDIDVAHGGAESLEKLVSEKDFQTATVQTGGGGWHFYFTTDHEIRPRVGVLPGVDIRGDGSYVVAPPSPHVKGRYKWLNPEVELQFAPWPFQELEKPKEAPVEPLPDEIPAGTRNQTLMSLAGSMRRRGASEQAILAALEVENGRCNPPLPMAEVRAIAKSAQRYAPAQNETLGTLAHSASDFLNIEVPPPQWLVHGMWPEQAIGFVAGPPKSFKSFYVLEMANAIASGKPFLGSFTVPVPRTVLLVQSESSLPAFKERVRKTAAEYGMSDNLFIISNKTFHLEEEPDIEKLRLEVANLRPALLILDPLASFTKLNENDTQSMQQIVRALRAMRDDFGCAIAVVHHARKTDSSQMSGDDMRGSSGLWGAAEAAIFIRRADSNAPRSKVRFMLKDGVALPGMDVQFKAETGTLEVITATQMLGMALAGRGAEDPYGE